MGDVAVSVEGLGKRYRILHQQARYGRLSESVAGLIRAPFDRLRGRPREEAEWFWALQDVSFEVKIGEVMGIIGRNGAGKSTLLKILSRITEPTAGVAELKGRVASLLEVGTGFHSELTGRENIYLSGSILGMRRDEIERRFDEIVAFAEVEQFLDTPVKRFSSGMQVRLGFAVAAHLEPEILIVDEVLAVGDASFQRKCLGKMEDVAGEGRAILFVSHNLSAMEALCQKALLLERGRIVAAGESKEVVNNYVRSTTELAITSVADRSDRQGDGRLRLTAILASVRTGAHSFLEFTYEAIEPLSNVDVLVGVYSERGDSAAWLSTQVTGQQYAEIPQRGTLRCVLDPAALLPGRYSINVHCSANGQPLDYVADAGVFDVEEGDFFGSGRLPPPGHGYVLAPHVWSVEPAG